MLKNFFLILIFSIFLIGNIYSQKGNLVIVGGALKKDNSDVYNKFIELSGGNEKAIIAIMPTAGASPQKSLNSYKEDLIFYGVNSDNIHFIEIAVLDDNTTPDVDESKWIENANNEKYVKILEKCTGVWFVGGDQMRIMSALINEDGSNSKVLDAIWKIYENGAVIGGSSAGAAIMSKVMIGAGTSFGALAEGIVNDYYGTEHQENGPLFLTTGLGFFEDGIIDQHFDAKARIGRLIVTAMKNQNDYKLSFGIDENTALVVYNEQNKVEVLGESGVTVINTSDAKIIKNEKTISYENIRLSLIEGGDIYFYKDDKFEINKSKAETVGNEYFEIPSPVQSGILVGYSSFKDLLTVNLVDNKGTKEVVNYSFDSTMNGFKFIFSQDDKTQGFWTNEPDHKDHYSALNVICNIYPVKIEITDLK